MQGLFGTPKASRYLRLAYRRAISFIKMPFKRLRYIINCRMRIYPIAMMEIRDSAAEAVAVWMRVETGRQKE